MSSNAKSAESAVGVSEADLTETATSLIEQFPDDVDGDLPSVDDVVVRLSVMTRSERKPTPLGVGVSDSMGRQSTRYCSSGCSTASNPASIISR